MKQILLLIVLTLISFQAKTETRSDITPVLKYSQNALYEAAKVESRYLVFVPEEVSFPRSAQRAKFEKAMEIMEEVMNSEEFKQKVIGYENSLGEREYQKNHLWNDTNQTLTNEDVYEVIMRGDEKMRANTIGEMNFNSWAKVCGRFERMGLWCRKVVGSTSPGNSAMIKLNWKFYSYFEIPGMVSNMVHEWIHLLGFLHGSDRMREEVPYVVGEIAGEVAANILKRESRSSLAHNPEPIF